MNLKCYHVRKPALIDETQTQLLSEAVAFQKMAALLIEVSDKLASPPNCSNG